MLRCNYCENEVRPCDCATSCPLYVHIPLSAACSVSVKGYMRRDRVMGLEDEDLPLELI